MDRFEFDSPEYAAYMREHAHERGERDFLTATAGPGMVAVDAGGHRGLAACAISKVIGESGRLYCFEPIPEHRELLRDNVEANRLDNVEVVPAALGERAGSAVFYRDGDGTSIAPKPGRDRVEAEVVGLDEFFAERGLERLELLNMDCEGSELLVLKGAEQLLRTNSVHVFAEVHHGMLKALGQSVGEITGFLRDFGYRVSTVSLDDLSTGEDWETCEYIYARR